VTSTIAIFLQSLGASWLDERKPIHVQKLKKSAVRACTDRLVSEAGFKFRRSAFRGDEPRVTLLVTSSLGFFPDAVPMDFSVNSVTPFYTAALLSECGNIEPLAKTLILFVKRWTKDRGICHAAKGHLSPYLWTLLVMYFMQVGFDEDGPLLPALETFSISSSLMCASAGRNPLPKFKATELGGAATKRSIGDLFREFIRFYTQRFDWRNEAVCVRHGRRGPSDSKALQPSVASSNGHRRDMVAPFIDDPFKPQNSLGTCMNAVSLERLHEELARAGELCERGASLTELLQPWVRASRAGSGAHVSW